MASSAASNKHKISESKKYTVKEYISFEETSLVRHEFNDGKLIPMVGTSDTHNEICFNLQLLFKSLLKDCKVYAENVKVQLADKKRYVYPDVFVTCDPRDLKDAYVKVYPSIICEVASEGTRVHDRTDKFFDYKKIKTLEHYILVDQNVCLVEHFYKNEKGDWGVNIFTKEDQKLELPKLNISIPIRKIYSLEI